MSLLVVERGMAGFDRGRNLDKLGMHAQDTAELFFTDVEVPVGQPARRRGHGIRLPDAEPRPGAARASPSQAVAVAQARIRWTLDYTKQRTAFGQPIAQFQNSKFLLAELHTETQAARCYVDRCVELHCRRGAHRRAGRRVEVLTTELQNKVVDRCVQLHGGYGYMREYPIARAWADSRIQTIYGGTSEIMKEIVGRSLTAERACAAAVPAGPVGFSG